MFIFVIIVLFQFLNTYIRESINHENLHAVCSVMYQSMLLATYVLQEQNQLRKKIPNVNDIDNRISYIVSCIKYYGFLCSSKPQMIFGFNVMVHDLSNLIMEAHRMQSNSHDKMLLTLCRCVDEVRISLKQISLHESIDDRILKLSEQKILKSVMKAIVKSQVV